MTAATNSPLSGAKRRWNAGPKPYAGARTAAGADALGPGRQQHVLDGGGHALHGSVPIGIVRLEHENQQAHRRPAQGGQEAVGDADLLRVAGKALLQHRLEFLHHAAHDGLDLLQRGGVLYGHKIPVLHIDGGGGGGPGGQNLLQILYGDRLRPVLPDARRDSRASIVSMVCAPFSHAAVRRVLPTIPPAPHHSGAGRH